jgi:hypothetical protein
MKKDRLLTRRFLLVCFMLALLLGVQNVAADEPVYDSVNVQTIITVEVDQVSNHDFALHSTEYVENQKQFVNDDYASFLKRSPKKPKKDVPNPMGRGYPWSD